MHCSMRERPTHTLEVGPLLRLRSDGVSATRLRRPLSHRIDTVRTNLQTQSSLTGHGEGGIRTLDTLPYTRIPGVRLRPLGHLSSYEQNTEEEGFEPSVRVNARLISNQVPSTTRPPLHNGSAGCAHSHCASLSYSSSLFKEPLKLRDVHRTSRRSSGRRF
jgi:hypothetical protein